MGSVSKFSLLAISIVLIAVFIAPGYVTAQSRNSCGCSDIPYLIDRLNQINAALDAIQRYEQTANPNAISNEIAPDPNPTRATLGDILSNTIGEAIATVSNRQRLPGSRECTGDMENHEDDIRSRRSSGASSPITETIRQSRGVYGLMAAEILRRLTSMPRSCRPTEWFGLITAVEKAQSTITITVPPQGRFNKGSETTTSENLTRTGTIWLNGKLGDPLSSWQVAGTTTRRYAGRMVVVCKKTGPNTVEERTITNGIHMEINTAGSGSLSATVGVSESDAARRSSVSLTLPAINVTKSGQTRNVSSGGCPGSDFNRTDPYSSVTSALSPLTVKIGGSTFPGNPIKAGGSETVDLLPVGATGTHTVSVTYNLYKFR